MSHQRLRGSSPGDKLYYHHSQPPPPPPRSSSLQQHTAYIYPSRRTVRRWGKQSSISAFSRGDPVSSHQRAPTPTVELAVPQYYIFNRPYLSVTTPVAPRAKRKTGTVYYPAKVSSSDPAASCSGTRTPCEWETDNESDCDHTGFSAISSCLYEDGNTGLRVLSSPLSSKPKSTYKPPHRTFAEYIWQYAQRLRKKGKRVRFVPQPTEIPAKPDRQGGYNLSRNSRRSTSLQTDKQPAETIPLTRAEYGRSGTSSGESSGLAMGSAVSKYSLGHTTRSRSRHHYSRANTQPQRITLPYSNSRDINSGGGSRPVAQTYTLISYPEYSPSTYIDTTPQSAYYLGTESIPALHSLGLPSPKSTPGKSPKSGSSRGGTSRYRDDHGKGRAVMTTHAASPDYHYGYYYQAVSKPPPPIVYRHQHRGTSATGAQGVYVPAQNVGHWSQEPSTTGAKRAREQSTGRAHGREKKLRRAKGVDDIRGSLRGRHAAAPAYHGGWVSVGA